ncbi:cell wall integrity and stress response component 4-like [Elysia marginata]|uniref:Cell wall integrity and stress response component 4-like n=1 Tax=Elysia marginata TaxID=1093978 RepID=A0AAV4FR80_9GAST|nr:cell wall integrity and stress response component 4-like [Elysia marginata]
MASHKPDMTSFISTFRGELSQLNVEPHKNLEFSISEWTSQAKQRFRSLSKPLDTKARFFLALSQNLLTLWILLAVSAMLTPEVEGHGRMMDPPSRNSMWRLGFSNPVNYNDNELYCGGRVTQWARNKGKCGVCGDAYHAKREHEVGGKYANGIVTRDYRRGDVIDTTIHITANHRGYFEFRLCPVEDAKVEVTQACLDTHILEREDGEGTKYFLPEGKSNQFFNISLRLPPDLTCERCVIQWKYRTGNTWDKNDKGEFCVGCGPQEEFYNCADVTIHPGKTAAKWLPRMGKVTKSEANTKLSDYGWKKAGYLSKQTDETLNLPLKTLNSNLVDTGEQHSKEKDLKNSITDYNKQMYSHLFMGNSDQNLSLGPTAVPFKWKAENPDREEVEQLYSRFGYGKRTRATGDKQGSKRSRNIRGRTQSDKNHRVQVHSKSPLSKLGWKSGHSTKADTHHSVSVYSQTLGTVRPKTNKASNIRSSSPFTPPPPDGDPDLLRIFPIYGSHPRHTVQQNEPSPTRRVKAVPNLANLHRTGDSMSPKTSRTKKKQPRWLIKSLRQRRRDRERSRHPHGPGSNLVGRFRKPSQLDKTRSRTEMAKCETSMYSPYCSRDPKTSSHTYPGMDNERKSLIQTSFHKKPEKSKLLNIKQRDSRPIQKDAFGNYKDNIEKLIHFLASLLSEQSESDSSFQSLEQESDAITDSQVPEDYRDGYSRSLLDRNPENSKPPRLEVYHPQVSRFHKNGESKFFTARKIPEPKTNVGFNRMRHGAWQLNEDQHTGLQMKNFKRGLRSDSLDSFTSDEAPISVDGYSNWSRKSGNNDLFGDNVEKNMEKYDASNLHPKNTHNDLFSTTSVDNNVYDNEGLTYNALTWFPKSSRNNLAWESTTAHDNREIMREYRRGMKRVRHGLPFTVRKIGSQSRFQPQDDIRNGQNSADNPTVSYVNNRRRYIPGKRRDRLDSSSTSEIQNPHRQFPQNVPQSNSYFGPSRVQEAFLPEPLPILTPETETFKTVRLRPSRETTEFHSEQKFPQSFSHFDSEGVSQVFDFEGRNQGGVRSANPNLPQQWQPLVNRRSNFAQFPNDNSLSQNSLPTTVTRFPRQRYVSAYLETPLDHQYPTGSPGRLVCKALVSLSGGMDQWCSDNCHANFCPPTTCVCYSEGQQRQGAQYTNRIPTTPQNHRQEFGRLHNIENNYDIHHNPILSEMPVPFSSIQLSLKSPHFSEVTQEGITPKLILDNEALSPKAPNARTRSLLTYNGWKTDKPFTYKQHPYSQVQLQGLRTSYFDNIHDTIRETQESNSKIKSLNMPTERKQRIPASKSLPRTQNKHVPNRNSPRLYSTTIAVSTTPNSDYPARNFVTSQERSTHQNKNGRRLVRTIPYSGSSYETNKNRLQNEASSYDLSKLHCEAIGAYSGLQHFDDWCTVTCQQTMCPLLLCSCKGYGYNRHSS